MAAKFLLGDKLAKCALEQWLFARILQVAAIWPIFLALGSWKFHAPEAAFPTFLSQSPESWPLDVRRLEFESSVSFIYK